LLSFILVAVNNLNIVSVAVLKTETDTPSIIDADAPLPFSIARKFLKMIGRGHTQILNFHSGIKLLQSHEGALQHFFLPSARFTAVKKRFRFGICKCLYHEEIVNYLFTRVKRTQSVTQHPPAEDRRRGASCRAAEQSKRQTIQ